ncbi:MAG: hypothetical protein JWM16_3068 [Verrucomicrobiales bacterium]|nr:hypothetical protein [Verrucomicrobiales bacterium]
MRQTKETNKNTDGVWGIRAGVWLLMFLTMLGCLMLVWFHPDSARPRASNSTPPNISFKQTQNRELTTPRKFHSRLLAPQLENATGTDLAEVRLDLFEQMSQDRQSWLDDPQF